MRSASVRVCLYIHTLRMCWRMQLLFAQTTAYICVLILLHRCPRTTLYVLTTINVSSYELKLLHMCPRSPANTTLAQQLGLDDRLPREGGRKQDAQGVGGGGSSGGGKGRVVLDLLSVVCARGYSECAVALVEALSEGAGTLSLLALLVQQYKY
jgi:uncharacterized membrane protein YgcG